MARSRMILAGLVALSIALPAPGLAKKKKKDPNEFPQVINKPKKEEKEMLTQVLPVAKTPPQAVVAEAGRLEYLVTPLSGRGLLSQQTREALKWLLGSNPGTIVKLRAFVAGTGDVRRVQEIVSEMFEERRLTLPALSVAQVGALPLEAAQVVIEATLQDRKVVNPKGVAFVSGQRGTAKDPIGPLQAALAASSIDAEDVRRVTCFVSSLDEVPEAQRQVQQQWPDAASNFVQVLRGALDQFVECEAVAAMKKAPPESITIVNPREGSFSQIAMVGPGRIAITGTQLGFRTDDADLRLAFDRLGKTLDSVGASYKRVVYAQVYTLLRTTGEKVNKMRYDYHGTQVAPAGTSILFESLPGLDASFGIDVVAVL